MTDWDRLAAWYPRQLRWERAALATAVDMAAIEGGETLVDLGCGTGALLCEAARRAPAPRTAIGVDSSAGMLARVPPLPDGWRVVRAPAEALPLETGSADVVSAAYLLHLLDPGPVLAEARRVLAPGGRLVCVTPFTRAPGAPLLRAVAAAVPGMRPMDTRPELVAAGFTVERARTMRRGYPSLCVAARR